MRKNKTAFKIKQTTQLLLITLTPLLLTGCMSIHNAASMGNAAEVKKQLAWGVSPNSGSWAYSNTPLLYASAFGRIQVVELLLEKGANVNIPNEGGETPLHYASIHGHVNVMKILLENGANPAMKGTGCGTPMQWAVRNGQIRSVKTLLDFGVDVDQPGTGGRTALMEAVSKQNIEMIMFLLDKGADVNVTTSLGYGCSPLFIADHYDNVEIGKILLEHGADPNYVCEGTKIHQSFLEKIRQ